MIRHASIIPLIGGETLGSMAAFDGRRPEYLMSYTPFAANDRHLLNYLEDVPYHVLDQGQRPDSKVDVVASVCPCAGLSQMSHGFSADSATNDWMATAADYVLGDLRPQVYWGENAPLLAGNLGKAIRTKMYQIARSNGYTMTMYRTKSLLHGVSQIRERSFYFFWRGDKTPILNFFNEPLETIETLLTNVRGNFQQELTNEKTPTMTPYYRFVLETIHPGLNHREFQSQLTGRSVDMMVYIEEKGIPYSKVAEWMDANGFPSEAEKCRRKHAKISSGGSIMRRNVYVPHKYINAFVGHMPVMMTHHVEDRHLTYRECMSIMGLPQDFELLNPKKNLNHVCQNVPVKTAKDMASEVRAVLEDKRPWVSEPYVFQHNVSRFNAMGEKHVSGVQGRISDSDRGGSDLSALL